MTENARINSLSKALAIDSESLQCKQWSSLESSDDIISPSSSVVIDNQIACDYCNMKALELNRAS